MSVGDKINGQVCKQVLDQFWVQVRVAVQAQIGNRVAEWVRNPVRDQVVDTSREKVCGQVCDQVWARAREEIDGRRR